MSELSRLIGIHADGTRELIDGDAHNVAERLSLLVYSWGKRSTDAGTGLSYERFFRRCKMPGKTTLHFSMRYSSMTK
jgi:hypothetical protein